MGEVINPGLTIKVIGNQWYWHYEYPYKLNANLCGNFGFDSYMVLEENLEEEQLRLLSVDFQAILPIKTHIRTLITSSDVLHSWAVPSLGVKLDACPGRLNQVGIFIKRVGIFYGQCSEICGVNHGFMPIAVKAVTFEEYVC